MKKEIDFLDKIKANEDKFYFKVLDNTIYWGQSILPSINRRRGYTVEIPTQPDDHQTHIGLVQGLAHAEQTQQQNGGMNIIQSSSGTQQAINGIDYYQYSLHYTNGWTTTSTGGRMATIVLEDE